MTFLTAGIIAILTSGLTYAILDIGGSATNLASKLDYYIDLKKLNFLGSSVKIVIDFRVINPTEQVIKLSHPLVMLYYKQINSDGKYTENFLAQNTINAHTPKEYTLPAYGQITIPNLDFTISVTDLVSILSNNFSELVEYLKRGDFQKLKESLEVYIHKIKSNLVYYAYFKVNGFEIKLSDSLAGLGYSPISAIDRPIQDCSQYDRYFKRPEGKRKIIESDAEVEDTVKRMHEIVEKDHKLISEFSELFKSDSIHETAEKIFDWVYKCLKYNIEKGEQLKNPLVSYELGQRKARNFYRKYGYYNPDYSVDCDDISIFIASILKNLGIQFSFRVAAYVPGRGYQHVYVVVKDKDGKEIIIDPVYYKFNAEKPPIKKADYPALAGIPVEYLSGISVEYLYGQNAYEEKLKNYLILSQKALNTPYFGNVKGKNYLNQLYDYLLKYWDTSQREKALQIVAQKEAELCSKGLISQHNLFRKLYNSSLSGFLDFITNIFHKRHTQDINEHIPPTPSKVPTQPDSAFMTADDYNKFKSIKRLGFIAALGGGYLLLKTTLKKQDNGTNYYKNK